MTSAIEIHARFLEGMALHQSGQLSQAQDIYQQVLSNEPGHSDALHMLGVIALQTQNAAQAAALIGRAVEINPHVAAAHFNHGVALENLRQPAAALASYEKAIALAPGNAEAYVSRGNMLLSLGQSDAAVASYDKAIALSPSHAAAYNNRSVALNAMGRFEAGLASAAKAIALDANYAGAYNNRGLALHGLRRIDAARDSFEKAIQIKPNYAEALNNQGLMLAGMRQDEAALSSYDRAIALHPNYAEAHNNRGNTLRDMRRWGDAIASYDAAIAANPAYAEPYQNRGHVLADQKQFEAAIASYDKCLGLKPDQDFLAGTRLNIKMMICDWRDAAAQTSDLIGGIDRGAKVTPTFLVLALTGDLMVQRKAAEIWVHNKHPFDNALGPPALHDGHEKIRLGYFSADFRNHPIAALTAGLFEAHDRAKFEIYAFSFGPDTGDEMRKRLERAFDKFIDVRSMADRDVAALARRMGLDIAIDLTGYTSDARTGIFALRAAPVQVNYLGYPGTMGAPYIDYLVADPMVIPHDSRPFYSEKIAYLPCYQANDNMRAVAPPAPDRVVLGLPPSGFVFCCFNNNYKILPATFDGWMRILKQVEGSVLWLFEDNPIAAANLRKEAARRGVDGARLIFAARVPHAQHLARHGAADLFLDTLPYNAHTTASDALWAGLPVLTCIGESFAGRVAASLLNAIGLPELATATQGEYEALAVALATAPDRLGQIKSKLIQNRLTTPLFDTAGFTWHMESAYKQMQARHQAGLPADHINVDAEN